MGIRRGAITAHAIALAALACTACTTASNGSTSTDPTTASTSSRPTTSGSSGSPSTSNTPTPSPSPSPTPTTSTSATAAPVAVVISYAAWDPSAQNAAVSAFIQGTIVSGGTCTLTMTLGSTTRTTSRAATADVSTTQCGTLTIPGTDLTNGAWAATMRFDATGVTGTSAPTTITVAK